METELEQTRREITRSIVESYGAHAELSHLEGASLPNRQAIWGVVEDLLRILFPGFLEVELPPPDELKHWISERTSSIERRLAAEIRRALSQGIQSAEDPGAADEVRDRAWRATQKLLLALPAVRDDLALDVQAAFAGDPAAHSRAEVVIAYPGLQAIAVHRMAHVLYGEQVPLVPRVMAEYAHSRTGIDLHPGARIGRWFFIDHGTGVVVGETSTIGDRVRIYQGVTLGASSFQKGAKRHPDIEDSVTIYSGATILGNITIGSGSIIGGNAWVTRSVAPNTKVVVRPPQQAHSDGQGDHYHI